MTTDGSARLLHAAENPRADVRFAPKPVIARSGTTCKAGRNRVFEFPVLHSRQLQNGMRLITLVVVLPPSA